MGCCLCRDEFEQQKKYCTELERELENALKNFSENDLDHEEKKFFFNKIRKCNEDIEKNIQKLQEIFKRGEDDFIKNGEIEIKRKQLDDCVNFSRIKSLKVSKIFLNYYINFDKPRNIIDIGLKRKTF